MAEHRRWRFDHLVIFFIPLLITLFSAIPVRGQDGQLYSELDSVVVAKGDKQFAPFEFINVDGEPDGFSVELFRSLMNRIGVAYTLELDDWATVQSELISKKIDLAIGMIYSPKRAHNVLFGIPHSMISYNIICRKDNDFAKIEDLAGKSIVVQKSDRAHEYLLESRLTENIVTVDNIADGIKLLASGEYDAVLSFDATAFYFVREGRYRNLNVHLANIEPEQYSIVVNTDNQRLLYMLNTALYQMKLNGEYDRIYYKWFGVFEKNKIYKTVWYILGGLGVSLLIAMAFVALLKKSVKEKTRSLQKKNEEMLLLVDRLREENAARLAIEKNLIKARDKAEESDKLKSAFLANMSHELRTPLNAIVGFSSLMCETDEREDREEYNHIIESNNDMLLKLINDILDLSKIESGLLSLSYTCFLINDECKKVFDSVTSGLNRPDLTFVNDYDEDCIVNADHARVSQVITNFLTNAIKFTENGTITLATHRTVDGKVEISVSDTGIGIDEAQLSAVFERFVKLDSFSQGNGLGLSICKNIIELMGGEIGAESNKGHGSRFWVRFNVYNDKQA